jgi:hypothetical protein
VARFVQEDPAFLARVKKGFDSLDHGDFLSHEEVGARIQRLFKAK